MRRREFITLASGAVAAWPLTARAQQVSKRPTVAFMFRSASSDGLNRGDFAERLRELGWTEGRTVAIEYHWSEGRPERIAEIAAELVQQKVHVIVTYGRAVSTLKQATTSIPIVAVANDPVGSGLVASLSHPGGNVTGLSLQAPEIAGKRLEPDVRSRIMGIRHIGVSSESTARPAWLAPDHRKWVPFLPDQPGPSLKIPLSKRR
jgi:putative ABC transport system substrate-binding protein